MKKLSLRMIAAVGATLMMTFGLAGCLKIDVDLEVSRFDTFSGAVVVAIAEELAAFSEEDPADGVFGEFFQENPGVTVEAFEEDGYVGERAVFEGAPFSALDEFNDDGSTLSLRRDDQHIIFEGVFDFSGEDTDNDAGLFGDQLLAAASDMEVSIAFPGPVVETNGRLDEENNTVTWKPRLGDSTYFYAKSEAVPIIPTWAWLIIGPGIVTIGLVVWLWLRRKHMPDHDV